MENNTLELKLQLPESVGKACEEAISIEAKSYDMPRSRVEVDYNEKENFLKMEVRAKDLSALRAAMNTYLRWVVTCEDLLHD